MRRAGRHLSPLLDQLVHPRVRADVEERARHRAFIASHLAGGLIAICFLPIFLAVYGQPRLIESLAFVWFISPIAIAALLSLTGRYDFAHLVSALNLTILIVFGSLVTGGVGSFLLPWLIIVPVEAALSRNRAIVIGASGLAVLGVLMVLGLHNAGFTDQSRISSGDATMFMAMGVAFAAAYAGSLALSIHTVYRSYETSAQRQNRRYQQTLEGSDSLVTWHSGDGVVREVAGRSGQTIGGALDGLLGDGFLERVHVADRPAFLTAISRAGQLGTAVRVEYRLATRAAGELDGPPRFAWVETSCAPATAGPTPISGKHPGIVAVTRSIDSFKEREFALIQAKASAEADAAAKSSFIAGLGHELRTPLTAMVGFSELLAGDTMEKFDAAKRREYAQIICTSGRALSTFIDDIMEMSRIEAGTFDLEPGAVNLVELIGEQVGNARAQALKAGIELKFNSNIEACLIEGDQASLSKAVAHLVDNAIKFSGHGGRVAIQLSVREGQAIISISDTGRGIERASIDNVTRAFFRGDTKNAARLKGAGIGLAYAKGIAELHAGTLEVDSELGGGTCITVCLPVAGGNPERAGKVAVLPQRKSA